MALLASRALIFSVICGLTVLAADLLFTVNSGVFQRDAFKSVTSELAVFLVVVGWSLIGAVGGIGIASARGRHLSRAAAVCGAMLIAVAGLTFAFICDRVFDLSIAYLLDFDGIAYVEQGLIFVALWWIGSSFLATLILSKMHQQSMPNNSLERGRDG